MTKIYDSGHVLATVRANPRRQNEGQVQYIQRVAVLSGLIQPEHTAGTPPGGWSSAGETLSEAPSDAWWLR